MGNMNELKKGKYIKTSLSDNTLCLEYDEKKNQAILFTGTQFCLAKGIKYYPEKDKFQWDYGHYYQRLDEYIEDRTNTLNENPKAYWRIRMNKTIKDDNTGDENFEYYYMEEEFNKELEAYKFFKENCIERVKINNSKVERISYEIHQVIYDIENSSTYIEKVELWDSKLELDNVNEFLKNTHSDKGVSRTWKVYAHEGCWLHESCRSSHIWDFTDKNDIRILETINADRSGEPNYTIIRITRNTYEECDEEFKGQLSYGIFETSDVNHCVEITDEVTPHKAKEKEIDFEV